MHFLCVNYLTIWNAVPILMSHSLIFESIFVSFFTLISSNLPNHSSLKNMKTFTFEIYFLQNHVLERVDMMYSS